MVLNIEAFRKLKLAKEEVVIEGLEDEGKLFVHQLSAREMADYFKAGDDDQKKGKQLIREHLIARTLRNENGELIFAGVDVDSISDLPQKVVVKLYSVASRLSPMADPDEAKREEVVKNSAAPSTASSTTSPSKQDDSTSD